MTPFAISLLSVLAVLLIAAALNDLRRRIIPNRLNAAIALLAIAWWGAIGLDAGQIVGQIGLAALVLAIFAGLFALGMMGGGDVKLIAALALWLPAGKMLVMLEAMAIGGGLLTVAMLIRHRLRRAPGRPEIPYGVAIVAATLLIVANDILTSAPA